MQTIDTETRLCAVIGNPVGHSLSPAMHNAAYRAAGLNYAYLAFRVEDVKGCLDGMRSMPGFRGMSVTIPHKLAVMEHLDAIDDVARHVGSVNTITNDGGRLTGTTTDGPGLLRALGEAGVDLSDRRVLFLGGGGAVRAVAFAVSELTEVEHVTLLGRSREKVASLVRDLRDKTPADVSWGTFEEDLREALATHTIVIQGTPVGMHPHEGETLIDAAMLRPEHVLFDMVYRPFKTRLLVEAEARGCQVIPGIEMLIHQAVLQFETWTGTRCPVEAMRDAAYSALKVGVR